MISILGKQVNRRPRRFGSYRHCDSERWEERQRRERISCEIGHVQDACLGGSDSARKDIRQLDPLFVHLVIYSLVLRVFQCFPHVVCCPLFGHLVFFTFDKSSITLFIFLRLYKLIDSTLDQNAHSIPLRSNLCCKIVTVVFHTYPITGFAITIIARKNPKELTVDVVRPRGKAIGENYMSTPLESIDPDGSTNSGNIFKDVMETPTTPRPAFCLQPYSHRTRSLLWRSPPLKA